ncbi:hypothetical protein [Rhodobacter sp. NSM]|uniref:hypothetical protein n=1 Tax=Rhodobacter sp. NSM TaxID=3457501 RepID=UPI003FD57493
MSAGPVPEPVAPPSRSLDESLLAVLREEAELAARQRRGEDTDVEPVRTAPSAIPEAPAGPVAAGPGRPAAATAGPSAPIGGAAIAEPMPRPRRDLLPDIEEINSSLRSNVARPPEEALPDEEPVRGSRAGYRTGFFLMIFIALILATAYVMAPRIAAEIPEAEPALRSYVAGVDEARLLLDRLLRAAVEILRGD